GQQLAGFREDLFLLVDAVEIGSEALLVEPAPGQLLEKPDQVAHFGNHEVEPVSAVEMLPVVARERPPIRRRVGHRRRTEQEQRGAGPLGPKGEYLLVVVGALAGAKDGRPGQATPG